jgi:hypothetical protein
MQPLPGDHRGRHPFCHGRGHIIYSLWTGDVDLAIYLWDYLAGIPRFPTVDIY